MIDAMQDYYYAVGLQTFRNMPPYLRRKLTVKAVVRILKTRDRYLQGLDLMRKCLISQDQLVLILQHRLAKHHFRISKRALSRIFQAEAAYYHHLNEMPEYREAV